MGSPRTTLMVLSILVLATMPIAVSADSDGDGISDATDDNKDVALCDLFRESGVRESIINPRGNNPL